MKLTLNVLLILLYSSFLFAQEGELISKDKTQVYFVRASGLGSMINFTYFDGEKVIGQFKGSNYMIYECEPGPHLFWARSENKSFVEAELEGGKMYLIDVIPQMGGIKAGVRLIPVNKEDYKLKKIQKLVTKKQPEIVSESDLEMLQNEMIEVIGRGMKKYQKEKEEGVPQLRPGMTIKKEDLIYIKK